ncbi:MAG: hypothetical protein AAGF15_07350 [Pseudomonadota bacterium]
MRILLTSCAVVCLLGAFAGCSSSKPAVVNADGEETLDTSILLRAAPDGLVGDEANTRHTNQILKGDDPLLRP